MNETKYFTDYRCDVPIAKAADQFGVTMQAVRNMLERFGVDPIQLHARMWVIPRKGWKKIVKEHAKEKGYAVKWVPE